MKILFVCKDRNVGYYDGKFGLWNSASFVGKSLERHGHECKLVSVVDGNKIWKEVVAFSPEVVILEAIWVTPEKVAELIRTYPKVRFICRIHSKTTFLANEGIAFEWLNKYNKIPNFTISANNLEFNKDLLKLGYGSVYLPNIYSYEPTDYVKKRVDGEVDIGCFGSMRPMKNHLQQAIAAILFADGYRMKLRFHINYSRKEQNGDAVYKNIVALFDGTKHELVEHEWMSHQEFLKVVRELDIGMQVSLSESFNIVTADYISQNVQVVTSPEIKFVLPYFTADPTRTDQIVQRLNHAFFARQSGFAGVNKIILDWDIQEATKVWLNYLRE